MGTRSRRSVEVEVQVEGLVLMEEEEASNRHVSSIQETMESTRKTGVMNVVVMSISMCIIFSAFNPTQTFMTTLNETNGYISLSLLYFVFACSNFVSPFLVRKWGVRAALVFGGACYCGFVAAMISSEPSILYPCSIVVGFGAAVIWTAQGEYLNRCAVGGNIGFLSGLFFGIFQVSGLVGNVGIAILIKEDISIRLIFTGLALLACGGVAVMLFLRRVDARSGMGSSSIEDSSLLSQLAIVGRLLRTRRMLLLISLFIFSGLSQSFMSGKFGPVVGKDNLGWFAAVLYTTEIVGSLLFGRLSDKFGRSPVVFLSLFSWMCAFSLAYWTYLDTTPQLYFSTAILMGIGDSGLNTQISSVLGPLFRGYTSAAFACFKFLQSLGYSLAMVCGIWLSVPEYILVAAGFWILSLISYFFLASDIAKTSNVTENDGILSPPDGEEEAVLKLSDDSFSDDPQVSSPLRLHSFDSDFIRDSERGSINDSFGINSGYGSQERTERRS